jgi:pyruvate/2-oxoglutarate dehydrogenase complex dihydrolipoamide dehydrogenase (E3) component
MTTPHFHELLEGNAHDAVLRDHVHPPDWANPTPAERYNLVVVGGGPAGLVAAFGAAALGAKVALVERGLLGGDCLNSGCVPSKALLRVAHAAHAARDARRFGIEVGEVRADLPAALERMREIRAGIAPHDSAERLHREGIDVFLGEARFTAPDALTVGDQTLRFARACIATGARPVLPPIPGLDTVPALTNETLFSLASPPERLVVIGAGVIGCELAQAYARLGVAVEVVDMAERVLPREDPDAAALVQQSLLADGVVLHLGVKVAEVGPRPDDNDVVVRISDGTEVTGSHVLVAAGRAPNTALGLEAAGVRHDRRGIEVDDQLRTSNPAIFAAGDVIGQAQFTHAADHQARIVVRNALFFGRARVSELVIPRVIYTDPELAAVGIGLDEAQADESVTTITVGIEETDRGRTDGETGGFCRVHVDAQGTILGATVVGESAGELLAPLTLAMTHGLGLGALATTIHPYPTRSELVFKVASEWNRRRLTPLAKAATTLIMDLRR